MSKEVSSTYVRNYLREREHLITSEAVRKNVFGRGRIGPETEKFFRKVTKSKLQLNRGLRDKDFLVLVGARGKKVIVPIAEVRKLDGSTGRRGRISNDTKQRVLSIHKG